MKGEDMTIYQINRLRKQTEQRRRILYPAPSPSTPEPTPTPPNPAEEDTTMRWDKIRDLRRAILAGEYDLDTKLEKLLRNSPALTGLQAE
ncbi:MAG: hypothetical protein GXY44_15735 [Phycisphaerales bacterium]|nr:hypothetical protein [Phycisphaerales bacterium]